MRLRSRHAALRPLGRVVALTVIAGWSAACSSDIGRFGDDPFSNPFAGQQMDRMSTGSVRTQAAPVHSVSSQPLPPPVASRPVMAQSVRPVPAAAAKPTYLGKADNWSAEGGTPVILGQGETILTLSNRYGVPPDAILKANQLQNASQTHVGQALVIPVYRPKAAAMSPVAAPARPATLAQPVAAQPMPPRAMPQRTLAASRQSVEASRATVAKAAALHREEALKREAEARQKAELARREAQKTARAETLARQQADHKARLAEKAASKAELAKAKAEAEKARIAAEKEARAARAAEVAAKKAAAAEAASKPQQVARIEPVAPPKIAADPVTTGSLPKTESAAEAEDFRWPARGRIISAYRRGGNEGINISLPEGTPVRAADSGTVAYAGSELKGYGNLVLIRHPNGFVTAYAHNGALMVKRGQSVSRGQEIATSGQSGNVASPQLHFELRKGATPIDPTPYLR